MCFRNLHNISAVWKHCSTSYSMTLSISRSTESPEQFIWKKHYDAPPPPPPPEANPLLTEMKRAANPLRPRTRCVPKRNAPCTEMRRAAHRTETRCPLNWNALRIEMKHIVHPQKATSWNTPRMENETRRQPCETHEPNALRRERDEPHYPPLEDRGTKKSYLSNLSSLHLEPACPTSWWEKPAHATRKNQNSKQASANQPNNTHRVRRLNGEERVGKMFQGKKELGPCRWENHEWRKTAQARWYIAQKISLVAWAGRNFLHWCLVRKIEFSPLSLCSAIENYYFV